MSCVILLTPVLLATGGFPAVCAAAVAVSAAMGFRRIREVQPVDEGIEVPMDNCEGIAGSLREDEKTVMTNDKMTIEFYKDARGRFAIHVKGQGLSDRELRKAGEELVGRVRQQLVYQKLMTEMEKRGYKLQSETVGEDRRIRIRLERG